jgi:hypothetical protein
MSRGELVFSVAESAKIDPQRLVQLLTHAGSNIRVAPDHKIYAPGPPSGSGPQAIFHAAQELLVGLGAEAPA